MRILGGESPGHDRPGIDIENVAGAFPTVVIGVQARCHGVMRGSDADAR